VTGSYVKYNNNLDWTEDKRNTPQAFSHWTYIQSEKQLMIVDIQVLCCASRLHRNAQADICFPPQREWATFGPIPSSTRAMQLLILARVILSKWVLTDFSSRTSATAFVSILVLARCGFCSFGLFIYDHISYIY
jgi:hypothetical protein